MMAVVHIMEYHTFSYKRKLTWWQDHYLVAMVSNVKI